MTVVIVLAVLAGIALALGAYVLLRSRRPAPVAAAGGWPDEDDGIVSEPVPIERAAPPAAVVSEAAHAEPPAPAVQSMSPQPTSADAASPEPEPVGSAPAPQAAAPREMCWAKRFAPRGGALDDRTRLGLIRDLALVRAPWGVPMLLEAYDEEPDAEHRRAVVAALALYRHLDARAVFERALRSEDEQERAIAGAALADLGVTASLPR